MVRSILLVMFFVSLAGCEHSAATPVRGPDGDTWMSITCRKDQENCYERAGEECPTGYDVASESGRESGAVAMTQNYGNGFAMTNVATKYRGNLLIKCKGSHAPAKGPAMTPDESPPPPSAPPVPPMCETAYANVKKLADTFVALNPGRQPVADLPSQEAFYKACAPMSDAAQVCIWQESEGKMGRDCDTNVWHTRDWLLVERLFLVPQ